MYSQRNIYLNRFHHLVGATWNDQIDVLVQLQQLANLVPTTHHRDGISTPVAAQGLLHDAHQHLVGVGSLLAALQQQAVGAGNCQTGNLL